MWILQRLIRSAIRPQFYRSFTLAVLNRNSVSGRCSCGFGALGITILHGRLGDCPPVWGVSRLNRSPLVRALLASAALVAAIALAGCNTDGTADMPAQSAARRSPTRCSPRSSRRAWTRTRRSWSASSRKNPSSKSGSRTAAAASRCSRPIRSAAGRASSARRSRKATARRRRASTRSRPGQMNPNSQFYLSFNLGYPNAFDRAHGRTGAHLMVHGDCSSRGCYAMTDEQIAEIYALGREAFFGGQRSFQVQAYPFRMTPQNMAKHRNNPHMAFWKMLKEGNDHFEVTQARAEGRRLREALRVRRRRPERSVAAAVVQRRRQVPGVSKCRTRSPTRCRTSSASDEFQIAELITPRHAGRAGHAPMPTAACIRCSSTAVKRNEVGVAPRAASRSPRCRAPSRPRAAAAHP